jgi:quercetin dioxygenase-like cupin family protein
MSWSWNAKKSGQLQFWLNENALLNLVKSVLSRKKEAKMTEKESNNRALKVQSMADLVNYQDGSVVSREIIRKSTGTVTLFAFDEGQGLSEHTAPFDALVYVVDGQVEVLISGKAHHLNQGDFVILPANETHALRALSKFKMLLVMIKSEALR